MLELLRASKLPATYNPGCGLSPHPANEEANEALQSAMASVRLDAAATGKYGTAVKRLLATLDEPVTIVLCGADSYRAGKTYLAAATIREFAIGHRRTARYTRAIDFFRELKATFGAAAERTALKVIAEFESPDLLVIDEIQVRSDSTWEANELRSLIDSRHANGKSTIICGNVAAASLDQYLDRAIIERIKERGGAIEANWPCPWKAPAMRVAA